VIIEQWRLSQKGMPQQMDTLLTNPARLRKLVIIGFAVAYALSLITPVQNDRGGAANYHVGVVPGFLALALGWIPPSTVPWSANILVLIGWILFWRRKLSVALWFGVAAALAGFTAPWLSDASMGTLLIGYYFWQGSLISFALGTLALRRIEARINSDSRTEIAKKSLEVADEL
jgi:hypothetical protein